MLCATSHCRLRLNPTPKLTRFAPDPFFSSSSPPSPSIFCSQLHCPGARSQEGELASAVPCVLFFSNPSQMLLPETTLYPYPLLPTLFPILFPGNLKILIFLNVFYSPPVVMTLPSPVPGATALARTAAAPSPPLYHGCRSCKSTRAGSAEPAAVTPRLRQPLPSLFPSPSLIRF